MKDLWHGFVLTFIVLASLIFAAVIGGLAYALVAR